MKLTARILSMLLVTVMLLGVVACGGKTDDPAASTTTAAAGGEGDATTTAATEATTENPYDENGYLKSSLPELDFKGEEVTILWWTDVEKPEFVVEEVTGDLINDAIYQRNMNVQEQLNVTFAWDSTKGQYNNGVGAAYAQYVGNGYNAGDTTWDLMAAHSRTIALTAMYGYCADLMELDYLDFSMPWWPTVMTETATIGDRMYFVTGDVSINSIHMMYCIFYNKDIMSEYKIQDPAELVKQGKWTMENLQAVTKNLYQDLNSNGSKEYNDFFGFTSLNWHYDAIYYGAGLKQADPDEENLFKISDDYFSEKAVNLSDYMGAWAVSDDVLTDSSNYRTPFYNGTCFMVMTRHKDVADKVVESGFSYGIVPIPKYDEAQERHITVVGNPVSFYSIYANSKDKNRAAAVLECWASEAYRNTTPALFETTMKLKYSETSTESEMYDIIRAGIIFDIGRLFNSDLGAMSDNWDNSVVNHSSWGAASAAFKKVLPKQLKKITDAFLKLQNS